MLQISSVTLNILNSYCHKQNYLFLPMMQDGMVCSRYRENQPSWHQRVKQFSSTHKQSITNTGKATEGESFLTLMSHTDKRAKQRHVARSYLKLWNRLHFQSQFKKGDINGTGVHWENCSVNGTLILLKTKGNREKG